MYVGLIKYQENIFKITLGRLLGKIDFILPKRAKREHPNLATKSRSRKGKAAAGEIEID